MVRNIYRSDSQIMTALLDSEKPFLVVPLDLAKAEHTAQCCTAHGRYVWKEPLQVWNNSRGVDYLLERVRGMCRKLHIPPDRVVFGGEDPGPTALNFIGELKARGEHFVRVSARKAEQYRKNSRVSSDTRDLDGVAHTMLHCFARDMEPTGDLYAQLRMACRTRRQAVKSETGMKSRIHALVDRMFPGFLLESRSGIEAFTVASLRLLEAGITPQQVLAKKPSSLSSWLNRHACPLPDETAIRLRELAKHTLPPPADLVAYLSASIRPRIRLLMAIQEEIKAEENEMARCLVQTPAALITSIPGVGVTLAACITAEYGDPTRWPAVKNMYSYAGCALRHKQTGGSGKPPVLLGLPLDCNRRLKDYLLQAAFHVGIAPDRAARLCGLPEEHRLMAHFQRLEARGGCSRLGTSRLFLRIIKPMVLDKRIYLPEWMIHPQEDNRERAKQAAFWLETATATMEAKWRKYDLSGIAPENNHLLKWRTTCHELIDHLRSTSS